jgi:hypothetical protein
MGAESSEVPPVRMSATVQLATAIEMLTESGWTQEKRHEVAEMIRAYRFEQVGAVMARVQKLVRESGSAALSEKIFMGKF